LDDFGRLDTEHYRAEVANLKRPLGGPILGPLIARSLVDLALSEFPEAQGKRLVLLRSRCRNLRHGYLERSGGGVYGARNEWVKWEDEMQKVTLRPFATAVLVLLAVTSIANAQGTARLRGTVERMEGPMYVVKLRDGTEAKVALAENGVVIAIVKASLSDIKQGLFVGSTGMPQADGSQKAIEVHIFPEAMRGTGEGHYPWDLRPQSTMTNANVEQTVAGVDGQLLTLKYKDGEKKILVTPDTIIVTYVPGDKSEITPGTKIFIAAAKKQEDGTFQAPRINYGKNGLGPPF
jgi:hypothetical protein